MSDIIQVRHLSLEFPLRYGTVKALRNVSICIPKGKVTALVGESGSGKTTLASALMKLVSFPGVITGGEILFEGKDVLKMNAQDLHHFRWEEIAMVFQAAQSALNPVMCIRDIIIETYLAHRPKTPEKQIIAEISKLFAFVRLEPQRILNCYPHELSGGMKQRVMIAFSVLLNPKFLILDEPTTALDVITQDYIFDILRRIRKEMDITMLLLTHDISVVAKVADRIAVMYAGKIVEEGDIIKVFEKRSHPYSAQLIGSVPSILEDIHCDIAPTSTALDLFHLPKGCAFAQRCPHKMPVCAEAEPPKYLLSEDHSVFCHAYGSEQQKGAFEKP